MNILKKLTAKNLSLNKKRAVGTVIGIILSVALICAVAGMFVSFHATLIENAKNENGYYHLVLEGINTKKYESLKLNKDIRDIYKLYSLGHSEFSLKEDESVGLLQVYSASENDLDELKFQLLDGTYPKDETEIVLSKLFIENNNYKIGDTIELSVGTRKNYDGSKLYDRIPFDPENEDLENPIKKTYKIVGVISRDNWKRVYYGVTTNETSDVLKAYISLKKPTNYKVDIPEILGVTTMANVYESEDRGDFYCTMNNELLRWEALNFSDSTLSSFYAIGVVVITIIIITSVFCIRNSFAISTLEKMKMYGMLASVGATKRQIKKSVIYEGFILGLIGIPIGILSGIFADFVIIKVVNMILNGVLFQYIEGLVFKVSFVAIGISVVLGIVTIYLSSIFSAIKASKVSPIENLRNSNDIKIKSKKFKTPGIISSLFKTGGTLAYKNLKRSKKKYRTTVISLSVSIFVFISLNSFISEAFRESGYYYTNYDYTMEIYNLSNLTSEEVQQIKELSDYKNIYFTYEATEYLDLIDKNYIEFYEDDESESVGPYLLGILALDEASFKAYAEKLHLSYESVKDKGILCDEYAYYSATKDVMVRARRYKYNEGDIIRGTTKIDSIENNVTFEVGAVTTVGPYGYERTIYDGGYLILNKDEHENLELYLDKILIDVENTEKTAKELKAINPDMSFTDLKEYAREAKSMILVISIFLYGFIAVISLIGVTNIFNTITSNMELRSKEFAMLKSIGMTKKEFNRMVNLETIFYSTKSLFYGTALGLLGAIFIHNGFSVKTLTNFVIPFEAIGISVLFVFIIVSLIMKYSIRKINKLNTIETIRNENI